MKFNSKLFPLICYIGLFISFVGGASAASLPKEGRYDYTACNTGERKRIDFSKTHWAYSFEQTGTVLSNPPGGMFDRSTSRCVGLQTSFDGKVSGNTVCESIDTDGDRRLTVYTRDGDRYVREQIVGTGKYDGMISSGTVDSLPAFAEIKPGIYQNCNHQTGTYTSK